MSDVWVPLSRLIVVVNRRVCSSYVIGLVVIFRAISDFIDFIAFIGSMNFQKRPFCLIHVTKMQDFIGLKSHRFHRSMNSGGPGFWQVLGLFDTKLLGFPYGP